MGTVRGRVSALVLIVILTISHSRIWGQAQYSFVRVEARNGLLNNQITSIFGDSRGFMWFGTNAGLSRYDGRDFVNYTHNAKDTTSITDNYIGSIQEDSDGKLWIKTRWQYSVFDPKQEIFINNISALLHKKGIDEPVEQVFINRKKQIWYKSSRTHRFLFFDEQQKKLVDPFNSTARQTSVKEIFNFKNSYVLLYQNGLVERFDDQTYQLTLHEDKLKDVFDREDYDWKIFADTDGDFWIYGDNKGIYYFNASVKQWRHYTVNDGDVKLSSNIIKKVTQDDKGLIWIGTDHGGIDLLNKYTKEIQTLYYQKDNFKSIPQNSITDIFVDSNHIIWIGTYKKGIGYYHESIFKFPHYFSVDGEKGASLPYNDVNCFAEDKKGNLWIGTNGGGLIYFDRNKNTYETFKNNPSNSNSLSNNVVVNLFIDNEGLLWIGTFTGGLNVYDGHRFLRFKNDKSDQFSLTNDDIWTITQDDQGQIWIGTLGGGICIYDKRTGRFNIPINQGSTALPSLYVSQIFKMRNGQMFVATSTGVIFYDTHEKRYRNHPFENKNTPVPVCNNDVNAVFEDSRGFLWIATREGLTFFNPLTNQTKFFDEDDGLPQDIMDCILEDNNHNIWVSKSTGLAQIAVNVGLPGTPVDFSVRQYNEDDGLQDQEFNVNAAFHTSKGELIFGGPNGFNLFDPKNITFRDEHNIVFTDFQVFNHSFHAGEKLKKHVVLEQSITYTDQVTLRQSMDVFSVQFADLSFFNPKGTTYRFMLDGFNQEWIDAGTNNKVTYTNLNAGKYILKVKARNNHSGWSENYSQLNITILPPFYATRWAYLFYLMLGGALAFYVRYSIQKKERNKLNLEHERLLSRRNHEMDEMKLRFLTNVSHEFRTPLTLILTPLERLIKKGQDPQDEKMLKTIERNANQLLDLVNQLLDFRKLDLYGLRFHPSFGDVVSFLKEVCHNFEESFKRKGVGFEYRSMIDHCFIQFDNEKLNKIMMNLISNALKFTSPGGGVLVSLDIQANPSRNIDELVIRVKDSGVGISDEDKERIFDRFYQSANNQALGLSGSGIGLNLAKEMVELHGGRIEVESEPGSGAEFIVIIPAVYSDEHSVSQPELSPKTEKAEFGLPESVTEKAETTKPLPSVLLIEDNTEFRTFMKETLVEMYTVYEAADGQAGLDLVYKLVPDLIISDVMMPRMDGLEMCRKLKTDVRVSHIPLILLTARTADEDKIKGLEIGADDYITKPFNMDLLLLRIQNLVEKQIKRQLHFKKYIDISPSAVEITSLDEKLIKKAIEIVEKNISEAKFSVEDLSQELGMSRVYLYKKLLTITGKSPIEFIRIIRLKRGAQLLEKSQMNVAEVAYEVGFNNPRYFSKYFKEEYGTLPTDYARRQKVDKA